MEELVGKVWHRLITRQAIEKHVGQPANLSELKQQLTLFYRAVGGTAGKQIVPSQARTLRTSRRFIQRIAGTHQKHAVSWQNDEYLSLPATISYFPDSRLNRMLYFWLTALAVKLPVVQHWFVDNQLACVALLEERPGLKPLYQQLVEASIERRMPLASLQDDERLREEAIRGALLNPGDMPHLPQAKKSLHPVCLWLYPAPLRAVSVAADDSQEQTGGLKKLKQKSVSIRQQARRIDDSKQTDGLLIFQTASLFSWAEQVELDRCQQDDPDEDLQTAAKDLDIVTLSRRRHAGSASIKFDLDLPAPQNDDLTLGDGMRFPEWDYRADRFIKDYCLVQAMLADGASPMPIPQHLKPIADKLRKRFSVLRLQRSWQRHQLHGEELDLDAWLRMNTQPVRDINRQDYYQTRTARHRDVACLLLADLSLSTDALLTDEQSIIDIIKDTLLVFSEALNEAGDQFGIYGFSSVKNTMVRYHILKNFMETYGDAIRGRIMAAKPGFYTRMGAAIRQSSEILQNQTAQQRLLLMISDGKPNDIDRYEGRYGIEDTRRAIIEARKLGLHPFCVTIDEQGNEYLPYLFGDNGFVCLTDAGKLPNLLPRLYLRLTATNY